MPNADKTAGPGDSATSRHRGTGLEQPAHDEAELAASPAAAAAAAGRLLPAGRAERDRAVRGGCPARSPATAAARPLPGRLLSARVAPVHGAALSVRSERGRQPAAAGPHCAAGGRVGRLPVDAAPPTAGPARHAAPLCLSLRDGRV